jgi:hypothetical protein
MQPMGGRPGLPSWFAYTGLPYAEAFPANPPEVNGYVVDFGSGQAIAPGQSLDGFFFQGSPGANDRFMLVGAHDPNIIIQGQPITEFGVVQIVPEPSGVCLAALLILIALTRRIRQN